MTELRRISHGKHCMALLMFFAATTTSVFAAQAPAMQMDSAKVMVKSLDSRGRSLRNSVGFILDDSTVVTSYDAVRGASALQVQSGEYIGTSTRVLSCSNFMDLALVKTTEAMPLDSSLASSDTLAAGDVVYYFKPDQKDWSISTARIKSYRDSGQGYEVMQLDPAPAAASSPLFNEQGKVVGWLNGSEAAPLKAIYLFFAEKESATPLAELNLDGKFWTLVRTKPVQESAAQVQFGGMKELQGTSRFPFHASLPATWPFQTSAQPDRYLLISTNGQYGITVALRVLPARAEDLMSELNRVEGLMFPGIPRAEMTPYPVDHFTGMKALYEESDSVHGYSSSVLCFLANRNLYVYTVTYPRRYHEAIQPLLEKLFDSFRI